MKKLLLVLFALSLFDVKAQLNYRDGLVCAVVILSGAGLENSRANWNTERKTVKEKVFYYSKLGAAAFMSVGVMYIALACSTKSNN